MLAGMNVNTSDVSDQIEAMITSLRSVDVQRLSDVSIPLEEV